MWNILVLALIRDKVCWEKSATLPLRQ